MIDKINGILNNTYELTQEEIALEDKIWSDRIIQCFGIDTEVEPTEKEAEAKRKFKAYQHEYYITHRKKSTKVMDMSDISIKRRASMAKLRNRLCEYDGEQIKYGTLLQRLHNKLGYSFPDAKKIADKYLINSTN